jgi:hypothetical protein
MSFETVRPALKEKECCSLFSVDFDKVAKKKEGKGSREGGWVSFK